jgi:hypothetical protein
MDGANPADQSFSFRRRRSTTLHHHLAQEQQPSQIDRHVPHARHRNRYHKQVVAIVVVFHASTSAEKAASIISRAPALRLGFRYEGRFRQATVLQAPQPQHLLVLDPRQ